MNNLLAGCFCFFYCLLITTVSSQPLELILKLETGMHNARCNNLSVDAGGLYILSCSADKTARLWEAASGKLLNVIRLPIADEGAEGMLYGCALSPDASLTALGGYTGKWENQSCIYIVNTFTGEILHHLCNLPNIINCLDFSTDGKWLAAGLGIGGVRVYNTATWQVKELEGDNESQVTGIRFSSEGKLATVSNNGYLRLYNENDFTLSNQTNELAGTDPFSIAFNASGTALAVGYDKTPAVEVFTVADLQLSYRPNVSDIAVNQDVSVVSFSDDGDYLYAGGSYTENHKVATIITSPGKKNPKTTLLFGSAPIPRVYVIRKWAAAGKGSYTDIPMLHNTVICLRPLHGGDMAVCSTNPDLAVLNKNDAVKWFNETTNTDFAPLNPNKFSLSENGSTVKFKDINGRDLVFSIKYRSLSDPDNSFFNLPEVSKVLQLNWSQRSSPTLNNKPVNILESDETCRSACASKDGLEAAWGGDYNLYLTDNAGHLLWKRPLPEAAFAVNIAGNEKVVAATVGDGTIRWFDIKDGKQLLALYITSDQKRWILYMPEGYYDASPGAEDLLGWHLNNRRGKAALFYPVSRFKQMYYRPDIIDALISTWNTGKAVNSANAVNQRKDVVPITESILPPVIVITSPATGTSINKDIVSVKYKIDAPIDAPVSNIIVLIDGRPQEGQRGVGLPQKTGNVLDIAIPKKDCTITLVAQNKNGVSPSADLFVRYTGSAEAEKSVAQKPNLYILCVGVSDYNNPGYKLKYAAADAEGFAEVFKKQKSVYYGDVIIKSLINKDATRKNIEVNLDWIKNATTSRDIAMIFFAGHGINDNGIFYMAPVEAERDTLRGSCLNFSALTQTVSAIAAKTVVFIDACHSGNVTGGRGSFGDINAPVNELSNSQNGAIVFTSSTGREASLEKDEWQHGAFTKALLDGIDKGEANYMGSKTISIKSLDVYISYKVDQLTKGRQHATSVVPPNVPDFTIAGLK